MPLMFLKLQIIQMKRMMIDALDPFTTGTLHAFMVHNPWHSLHTYLLLYLEELSCHPMVSRKRALPACATFSGEAAAAMLRRVIHP